MSENASKPKNTDKTKSKVKAKDTSKADEWTKLASEFGYEGAAVIPRNDADELLFLVSPKGQAEFPGGKIEPCDHADPIKTGLRELHEETGLLLTVDDLQNEYRTTGGTTGFPAYQFITKPLNIDPLSIKPEPSHFVSYLWSKLYMKDGSWFVEDETHSQIPVRKFNTFFISQNIEKLHRFIVKEPGHSSPKPDHGRSLSPVRQASPPVTVVTPKSPVVRPSADAQSTSKSRSPSPDRRSGSDATEVVEEDTQDLDDTPSLCTKCKYAFMLGVYLVLRQWVTYYAGYRLGHPDTLPDMSLVAFCAVNFFLHEIIMLFYSEVTRNLLLYLALNCVILVDDGITHMLIFDANPSLNDYPLARLALFLLLGLRLCGIFWMSFKSHDH